MKLQVLLSCMNEKDFSIVSRTNIQCDTIVVNQCDEDKVVERKFQNKKGDPFLVKMICTSERGLSRSRNMAIKNCTADICLLCDDDEYLEDDYPEKIMEAYKNIPDASLITFIVAYKNKQFPSTPQSLGIVGICRSFSVQISFKRENIVSNNIKFDEKMGSGSGNGAGEENKFLMDIYRKKLKLYFYPSYIGKVLSENSLWNHGYNEKYFLDRGWSTRKSFGPFYGYLFLWYNILHHKNSYTKDGVSFCRVLRYLHKGFFEKR